MTQAAAPQRGIEAYPSVTTLRSGASVSPGARGKGDGEWVTISCWELGRFTPLQRAVKYGSDDHIAALAAIHAARARVGEGQDLRLQVLNGPRAGETWEVGPGMMNEIMFAGDRVDV